MRLPDALKFLFLRNKNMEWFLYGYGIIVKQVLAFEPYLTLLGTWNKRYIVIKCVHGKSIPTDEYKVLRYIAKGVVHPNWFPKPCMECEVQLYFNYFVKDQQFNYVIRRFYAYEYISSTPVDCTKEELIKMRRDLSRQLIELNNIGLIYNNIVAENIIRTKEGYRLIGFDKVWHVDGRFRNVRDLDLRCPKMEKDRRDLEVLLESYSIIIS